MTETALARRSRQDSAANIHRTVLDSLRKLLRRAAAVKVSQIAKDAEKDPRTVKYHLELLEASGAVVFLDAERSVLGAPDTLTKAVRDAVREPWDRLATEELRDVWDNEADERWNTL